MIDWSRTEAPFFDAVRPELDALQGRTDQEALNTLATARGSPVRFGAPLVEATGIGYERRIEACGVVPTRENAHDFFNAVQWIAFPQTKAAINAAHLRHLRDTPEVSSRSVGRDVITMIDESGVLVASEDASLLALLREFRWRSLFVTRRTDVVTHMRFALVGHGLMEKALDPFIGLTAKAVLLHISDEESLDVSAARWLANDANLVATRNLAPLPLLGIPGWDRRNEDPAFYDNTDYFRAGRLRDHQKCRVG
jgi:hypothetical protein